jgi:hypothetical protein
MAVISTERSDENRALRELSAAKPLELCNSVFFRNLIFVFSCSQASFGAVVVFIGFIELPMVGF